MFLWVSDFYSLEKIISAFPKIVLLYLKKKELEIETGEGLCSWDWEGGRRGLYCLVCKS